jgi:hypothetical protein
MKIISVKVEIRQGLPNYSSRSSEVQAVADENESLDVYSTILDLSKQIKGVWDGNKVEAPAPVAAPAPVVAPAPKPAKAATKEEKKAVKDAMKEEPLVTSPAPKRISNPLDED